MGHFEVHHNSFGDFFTKNKFENSDFLGKIMDFCNTTAFTCIQKESLRKLFKKSLQNASVAYLKYTYYT